MDPDHLWAGARARGLGLGGTAKMMQAWSDYLEGLKAGQNVVPLHRHP
jgi:hypothetical protein